MQDDHAIPPDDTLPLDEQGQRRVAVAVAVVELRADDVGSGQYRVKQAHDAPRVVYDWPGSSPAPIAEVDGEGIHAHPGAIDRHPQALLELAEHLNGEIRCPCTKLRGRHGTVVVDRPRGGTAIQTCSRCDGAAILNHTLDEENTYE